MHESCIIKYGKSLPCDISYRGKNYYINSNKTTAECYVAFWGMTHFLLYAILGYLHPTRFIEFNTIGILFELYEKKYYDCHDSLDILLNMSGFMLGSHLTKRNLLK